MKKLFITFCVLSLISWSSFTYCQTKTESSEITSTVPELSDFHEIIYPMWHNAYPAKDYQTLKGFVLGIKTAMESINKAKLPGILRDKEAQWKNQLTELNNSAQNYYKAAQGDDNNTLLSAAESLHSAYEKMGRVIRPAIKEIDDFHQTLYVIYHKLYPDGKYSEIAGMTGMLVTKAEAIVNYPHDKLKNRLGNNLEKFDASAKKLYNETLSLKEVLKGDDPKKKNDAVESLHRAYQDLDTLFN
jgi:hypothetical protein